MSRPSKMTPKKIATLRAARASGKGLRAAAKEAGVSHQTVANWEAKAAKGSTAKPRPRRGRAARPAAGPDAAELAALVAAPLPEALADVRARVALVRGLLERLAPGVEADEYPATSYVTLARYGDELARLLAELTPPAPKDPNEDAEVLEAGRILLSRIEGMVAAAEMKGASSA